MKMEALVRLEISLNYQFLYPQLVDQVFLLVTSDRRPFPYSQRNGSTPHRIRIQECIWIMAVLGKVHHLVQVHTTTITSTKQILFRQSWTWNSITLPLC